MALGGNDKADQNGGAIALGDAMNSPSENAVRSGMDKSGRLETSSSSSESGQSSQPQKRSPTDNLGQPPGGLSIEQSERQRRRPEHPQRHTDDLDAKWTLMRRIGYGMAYASDRINDNIVAFRYGTAASVALLAAYGVSQSPLFFRYRTASEIPRKRFLSRRKLRCRIIRIEPTTTTTTTRRQQQPVTSSATAFGNHGDGNPIRVETTLGSGGNEDRRQENGPIRCYLRHLSPAERFLSRYWFERFMKIHPGRTVSETFRRSGADLRGNKGQWEGESMTATETSTQSPSSSSSFKAVEERDEELLCVEIAGIRKPLPPPVSSGISRDLFNWAGSAHNGGGTGVGQGLSDGGAMDFLNRLARERTAVTCQLLARRVILSGGEDDAYGHANRPGRKKRKIPDLHRPGDGAGTDDTDDRESMSDEQLREFPNQVAICKLYYRPKVEKLRDMILPTDMGQSMVRLGRATVATAEEGLLYGSGAGPGVGDDRILDATDSVKNLRKDASYIEDLQRAEYEAVAGSYGMWSNDIVRRTRSDIVDEVEFQTKAPLWRKLWRWLRGG